MSEKIFDILVVGSGLSSMSFIEEYLKKKKKINIISPSFKKDSINKTFIRPDDKGLPPQFKKNFSKIAPFWYLLFSNWLIRAYKNYNDIDKFLIFIYLINKNFIFTRW